MNIRSRAIAITVGCGLATTSLLLGFLLLEVLCRLILWSDGGGEFRNFAADRTQLLRVLGMYRHDPELGWSLRPDHITPGTGRSPRIPSQPTAPPNTPDRFSADSEGFRSNGPESLPRMPARTILVVGDSFAGGSMVSDEETWPAQLER